MAHPPLHLYYWPSSAASQKPLLVLEQKNLKYGKTIVNISEGEHLQPWYLRINPAGQVPVLKIGETFVADSEAIFDALQGLNTGGPDIVPDQTTPEGALVQHWRKRLSTEVRFERLTFGTILNPQVADGKLNLPAAYMLTKEQMAKKNEKSIQYLKSLKPKHPDLAETVDKKIQQLSGTFDLDNLSEQNVREVLKDMEKLFDDVEIQLRKSRDAHIVEHWLCGPHFTAADASLIMLIGRIDTLTYFSRFVNAEQRPALLEYWNQACRQPFVQNVVLQAKSHVIKYFMCRKVKHLAFGSSLAVGVLALALFLGHKLRS